MIRDVIRGVVAALNAAFEGVPVYTENVPQALEEPSFSVVSVRPARTQVIGARYFQRTPLCVYYFPSPEGGNREIDAVIARLFDALELVDAGDGPLRGTNMEAHVEDGVTAFSVNYDFFIRRRAPDSERMRELELEETIHETPI